MKNFNITLIMESMLISSVMFFTNPARAQSDKEKSLMADCNTAKADP